MFDNNTEYTNKTYTDLDIKGEHFENVHFDNCSFNHCILNETKFTGAKFTECSFKACSLNLIKLPGSSFIETQFNECKMTGINWTQIRFPYVTLESPLFITNCDISFSSFYELKLPNITMTYCKAHEVDFRGADLSSGDLSGSDLYLSEFGKTNLKGTDLRTCTNYRINPTENIIEKAYFSMPEAISLLSTFNINIDAHKGNKPDLLTQDKMIL